MELNEDSNVIDESEIPLNDEVDVVEQEDVAVAAAGDKKEDTAAAASAEDETLAKILTPHQLRMQQLLLKMNQARQLNRQAVQEEGSNQVRPGSKENLSSRQQSNKKTNPVTSLQAADAIQQAQLRSDRQQAAQHSMHDYHNPEAQHRQYQRSVKSIYTTGQAATSSAGDTTSTFDPLLANRSKEVERQGAHRLAQEMQRRIEKKRKNEAKKKEKEEDVAGHINKRNKSFNKKLDRNYQDHVKEIQQNLERGTAL